MANRERETNLSENTEVSEEFLEGNQEGDSVGESASEEYESEEYESDLHRRER